MRSSSGTNSGVPPRSATNRALHSFIASGAVTPKVTPVKGCSDGFGEGATDAPRAEDGNGERRGRRRHVGLRRPGCFGQVVLRSGPFSVPFGFTQYNGLRPYGLLRVVNPPPDEPNHPHRDR